MTLYFLLTLSTPIFPLDTVVALSLAKGVEKRVTNFPNYQVHLRGNLIQPTELHTPCAQRATCQKKSQNLRTLVINYAGISNKRGALPGKHGELHRTRHYDPH